MTDFTGEILSSLIVLLLYAAIFGGAEFAHRRFRLDPEVTRKIAHVAGGLLALFLPSFFQSHWTVVILGVLFFLVLALTKRAAVIRSVHDVERRTNGELYFPLALAATYLAASLTNTFHFYPVAILSLTLGDTTAWLIGRRYGKHRYQMFGDNKSVEGSVGMACACTVIVLVGMFVHDPHTAARAMVLAPFAGMLAAVLEAISPRGTDNLTVPLGVWGILTLTLG